MTEEIKSRDGSISTDPKLVKFHNTRDNPTKVICMKDNPPMIGFGKRLKKGDIVEIKGTTHNELWFCVSVPEECAFYSYRCFEELKE